MKRDVRMSNQPLADELKAVASVIAALNDPLFSFQDKRRILIAALTLMQDDTLEAAVREAK